MGKRPKPQEPETARPEASPAAMAPWRRRAGAAAALGALLLASAWALLCLRAGQHYRAGLAEERSGRVAGAAREFESAVGCCAPLNPYCGAAARRMLALADGAAPSDPALAAEVRDRMARSVRAARGFTQPHRDLLAAASSGAPPPRDPRGGLFLLSLAALAVGLGVWWVPRPLGQRAAVGCGGLGLWALLLYLC